MAPSLFKIWTGDGERKAVVAENFVSLRSKVFMKFNREEDAESHFYMEDGTEVDDDDTVQAIPSGTVLYFLRETEQKPWLSVTEAIKEKPDVTSAQISIETDEPSNAAGSYATVLQNCRPKPWPYNFEIADSTFSTVLKSLLQSGSLNWETKSELLTQLSRQVRLYTAKPNKKQRDQVARALIAKFPSLSSGIGEGYSGWEVKLYDKMREHNRKGSGSKRSGPLVVPTASDVTAPQNTPPTSKKKRRWIPPPPDCDDLTCNNHKEWLMCEFRKNRLDRDTVKVNRYMELSFSSRCTLLQENPPLKVMKEQYPFLFTITGVINEFKLLKDFDINKSFMIELNDIAKRLIKIAETTKRTGVKEVLMDFNNSQKKEEHINKPLVASLCLLPLLLSEDAKLLYICYPEETSITTITSNCPVTPHVAVIGDVYTSSLVFVIAENEILIEGCEFVESVMACLAVYFCCNIDYPGSDSCVYKFLHVQMLKFHDLKVPRKVLTLCEKLKKEFRV